jgi:hypothetical protein
LPGEVAHDLLGRAGPAKGLKEQAHGSLNLRVGIEHKTRAAILVTKPIGGRIQSSSRRALLREPPISHARSTCSSASLIVPLSPTDR